MRKPVGVAGVVATLSVTSDLTRGHPPGEAMRAALLRFAGCAATSHDIAAALGGDDIVVRDAALAAAGRRSSRRPRRLRALRRSRGVPAGRTG